MNGKLRCEGQTMWTLLGGILNQVSCLCFGEATRCFFLLPSLVHCDKPSALSGSHNVFAAPLQRPIHFIKS